MHEEIDTPMSYLHNMIHKDIQNFLIVIIELPHIKMYQLLIVGILCSFLFRVHY